ncbi:MAG: MFS transporter [Leptospirales bacterium]|nr:MFS transporter [Leptospirales bacterium]
MSQKQRAPGKEIFGWAMFDFANSSYTTVIITVVYSTVFSYWIVGQGHDSPEGNFYWGSVALTISYLIVLVTAPIVGAVMDFSASKKKFLFGSYILTVVATAALYFARPGDIWLAVILIVISNIGFSAGEAFAAAFLPELGPQEDQGRISGIGWGVGYFGGILSTLIISLVLAAPSTDSFAGHEWIGPITGVFFLVAGIPTFLLLKERAIPKTLPPGASLFTVGFSRLRQTLSEIGDYRDLAIFLLSFIFSYAALSIVISFAFIYGDTEIAGFNQGYPGPGDMKVFRVGMFLLTNISAAVGAIAFGYIQDRFGDKRTYILTLIVWIVATVLIAGVKDVTAFLNSSFGLSLRDVQTFLVVGSLAGLCLGATQSSLRALVGALSPASKAGEFFGFWNLTGKIAAIIGLFSFGALQLWLGLRGAILICAVFNLAGIVVALFGNEKRGKEMALRHEGE